MSRRAVVSGKDVAILGLVAAVVYLVVTRKDQVVIRPTIETEGLTKGVTDTAAGLVDAYRKIRGKK